MARDMNLRAASSSCRDMIGEFACFVGGMTRKPVHRQVPLGQIVTMPKMHPTQDFGYAQKIRSFRKA